MLSDAIPYGDDYLVRRLDDLEVKIREQGAARSLAASQIGSGGTLKIDGTLQVTGDLDIPDGALSSSGSMTAGTTVSAGSSVTAGTDVHALDDLIADDDLSVGGDAAMGGNISLGGYVFSPAGYSYDITYTRHDLWIGNDGRMAWASSSREKKTDIEDAAGSWVDPLAVLEISSKVFHYRAEIAKRDDPDYPEYVGPGYHVAQEFGAIAEELHDLGLWMVVAYEDYWKPVSIHYSLLGLLAIEASKYIWQRHLALRAEHLALSRRVESLEILAGMTD